MQAAEDKLSILHTPYELSSPLRSPDRLQRDASERRTRSISTSNDSDMGQREKICALCCWGKKEERLCNNGSHQYQGSLKRQALYPLFIGRKQHWLVIR